MAKSRLYIAYGSNLHLPQMAFRCPTAKVVGASEVKGFLCRKTMKSTSNSTSSSATVADCWKAMRMMR